MQCIISGKQMSIVALKWVSAVYAAMHQKQTVTVGCAIDGTGVSRMAGQCIYTLVQLDRITCITSVQAVQQYSSTAVQR